LYSFALIAGPILTVARLAMVHLSTNSKPAGGDVKINLDYAR